MSDQRKAAIEAMARAIWADRYPEVRWDDGPSRINLLFIGHATAALDALLGVLPALGVRVVPDASAMTDEQAQAISDMARCCGGIAYDIYRVAIAAPNVLGGSDGE